MILENTFNARFAKMLTLNKNLGVHYNAVFLLTWAYVFIDYVCARPIA